VLKGPCFELSSHCADIGGGLIVLLFIDFACARTAQHLALTLHVQHSTWMQTRFMHLQQVRKHSKELEDPNLKAFRPVYSHFTQISDRTSLAYERIRGRLLIYGACISHTPAEHRPVDANQDMLRFEPRLPIHNFLADNRDGINVLTQRCSSPSIPTSL